MSTANSFITIFSLVIIVYVFYDLLFPKTSDEFYLE